MAVLVCSSTREEMGAMAPGIFPAVDAIPEMRPMRAEIKGREIIFLVTGIGVINAALSIGVALGLTFDGKADKSPVEAILYAGLAGAYDLTANPLRSLWQISEEIWPEYGLHDGQTVTARAFRFPQWKNGDEEVYDSLKLAPASLFMKNSQEPPWPECASLTVSGVSASFERRETLWNKYHAPLENMEGFAAAYAALRAEIPCVEIRSVANKIGPRTKEQKDFDGALLALGKILPALNLI